MVSCIHSSWLFSRHSSSVLQSVSVCIARLVWPLVRISSWDGLRCLFRVRVGVDVADAISSLAIRDPHPSKYFADPTIHHAHNLTTDSVFWFEYSGVAVALQCRYCEFVNWLAIPITRINRTCGLATLAMHSSHR